MGLQPSKSYACTPPLRAINGWPILYHAIGRDDFCPLGAMLLDLDDPTQVRYRTPDWIIQPGAAYEIDVFRRGWVFPGGIVVIEYTLYV
ncbi:MAG: hypothetical protein AAF961_08765 [Planctomycetota bacterium]